MKATSIAFFFIFLLPFFSNAQNPVEIARSHIEQNKNSTNLNSVQQLEFKLSSDYKSSGTNYHYVYFTQDINGIGIYNAIYNVVVDNKNNVVNSKHSFSNFTKNAETVNLSSIISAKEALSSAFKLVDRLYESEKLIMIEGSKHPEGILSKIKFVDANKPSDTIIAKLEWLPLEYVQEPFLVKNNLLLTWSIDFEGKTNSNHWLMHFHATSGHLLQKKDLVIHCTFGESPEQHAQHSKSTKAPDLNSPSNKITSFAPNSYHVFDIPVESPIHGSRSIVTTPYTRFVPSGNGPGSTNGWHHDGTSSYTTTRGNNVWASEDNDHDDVPGFSPDSPTLDFNFPFTHGLNTAANNQSAAITNLFYWNNLLHNILYKYGFDELSGNFQNSNMGRGGVGGDYVRADAQDGEDTDNANFYTPVDGGVPRMQMFLWSPNSVYQPDSDFDNGIIAHEYGHGWSTRLTGGPQTNTCLYNLEQGGEGWSDFLGLMLTTDWSSLSPNLASANLAKGIGTYSLTQPSNGVGIRPYKYSYDMVNVNSAVTYGQVSNTSFSVPHGIGSIWATILWDLTWEIIMLDDEIVDDIWNTSNMIGNVAALKLVHEGLRLQKCSPSFIDARDAIFEADSLYFSGRYKCVIDKAFTRRGLGLYASTGSSTNDRIVFEDFTPIFGPKLSSPSEITTCSNLPFNHTLTSNTPGTTFTWTRAAVSGISNTPVSGSGSSITETLINTAALPVEVIYSVTLSAPSACTGVVYRYDLKVLVSPSNSPSVDTYSICQGASLPSGQGLKGTVLEPPTPNSINETVSLGSGSAVFSRPSSSSNFYHKITPFTCNYPGSYVIQLDKISTNVDPFLFVYSNFNPSSPNLNLLSSDDDGNGGTNSRIVINLSLGQTIYIVSTDYYATNSGNYSLKVDANFTPPPTVHRWFLSNTSTTALSTDFLFNPLLTPGSGISNTNTPGIHTFYYSRNSSNSCRIPVNFMIDSTTVGGSIASVNPICPGTATNLTLTGFVGSILGWESSTDNFYTITAINSHNQLLTIPNISVETQYRVQVKSGNCATAFSSPITVTIVPNNLHVTTNYNSGIRTDKAIQNLTGVNKIIPSANVTYRAGKSIELQPGFEASSSSTFKAEIGGCTD